MSTTETQRTQRTHRERLLTRVDVCGLDVRWNELPVDQVLHGDWSFKNSSLDCHVTYLLQIFIGRRQHSITYTIGRLGQYVANYLLVLTKIWRHNFCCLQPMPLRPFTAFGNTANQITNHFRAFANQFLSDHQYAGNKVWPNIF